MPQKGSFLPTSLTHRNKSIFYANVVLILVNSPLFLFKRLTFARIFGTEKLRPAPKPVPAPALSGNQSALLAEQSQKTAKGSEKPPLNNPSGQSVICNI
jgi:hypothetical protein